MSMIDFREFVWQALLIRHEDLVSICWNGYDFEALFPLGASIRTSFIPGSQTRIIMELAELFCSNNDIEPFEYTGEFLVFEDDEEDTDV